MNKQKTELIVALDTNSLKQAKEVVSKLASDVKFFKIGSQLFTASGPKAVEMVRKYKAEVFLDLKFHDIPNTVAQAAVSALKLGVFMFNVHALGGRAMLLRLMETIKAQLELSKTKKPIVLGVTVLTSMDRAQLNSLGIAKSVKNEVLYLAGLCKQCGLDGVVCSGREIKLLKRVLGNDFILVVPGVRPEGITGDDQMRVITASDAQRLGADYIVVGRPILNAKDPKAAAKNILKQIGIGEK